MFEEYGFDIPTYKSKKSNKKIIDSDDNWGEPNSMDRSEDENYSLEAIVDMPVMGEVVTNNSEAPNKMLNLRQIVIWSLLIVLRFQKIMK